MRIAVVEDSLQDQAELCALLEQYYETKGLNVQTICFSSGDEMKKAFSPGVFQCVFLDIYMSGTNGMDLAREIYRMDPACRLIFCTVSISHAVESYHVHAAWYLTKPVTPDALSDAMDAALLEYFRNHRSLCVHVHGAELKILFEHILFLDCSHRKALLHLREQILEVDEPVGDLLAKLSEDPRFLSCNRNTLVNMDQIEAAEAQDFRLKNGVRVPLRQRGRAGLKKAFLVWSLRELRREAPV